MSRYNIEKKLHSCHLEKTLLIDLESYIIRKFTTILNKDIKNDFIFSIKDSLGTEKMQSVDEFKLSYFPNDSKSIVLHLSSYNPSTEIDICFDTEKHFNTVRISLENPNAREMSKGILAELNEIMKPYNNFNFLFHINPFFEGILIGLLMISSSSLAAFFANKRLIEGYYLFLFFIFVSFYFIIKKIKPYTVFNTRLNEKIDKWSFWIFSGIIGFILFNIVGIFFRQKIFGF